MALQFVNTWPTFIVHSPEIGEKETIGLTQLILEGCYRNEILHKLQCRKVCGYVCLYLCKI